jgi:O-antigen/teichoic acid export membrane protein
MKNKKKFKERFASLIERLYMWIFKTNVTPDIKIFIRNLGWLFMATVIAKIFLFIINVFGGRVLGPEKYGSYNVIISVASFLLIPVFLGISAALVKYVAEEKKAEKKKSLYSTVWIFFIACEILFVALYFIFRNQLKLLFGVNESIFVLAIILTFFWALWSFMDNSMQGLLLMKKLSKVIIISNAVMFAVFLLLLASGKTSTYSIYLLYIPLITGYLAFFIGGFFFIRKYLVAKFESRFFMKQMVPYALWATVIALSTTFFGNIDILMLNYFLGVKTVGIYQAYYFSSIMMVGVLTGIFVKVFVPTSLQYADKKGILKRLNKTAIPIILFVLIAMPFVIWLIITLYSYEINFLYILLFTFATLIDSLVVIYTALLSSLSIKSIKRSSIGMLLAFCINVVLNYFLIPKLGLIGAITATICSLGFMLVYVRINLHKLIKAY